MKKFILSTLLIAFCSLSYAQFDFSEKLDEETIQMNYKMACGTVQDLKDLIGGEELKKSEMIKAHETRDSYLAIISEGQTALDRELKLNKYSGMLCMQLVAAKDMILKSGCFDLTSERQVHYTEKTSPGLAVCENYLRSGKMPSLMF